METGRSAGKAGGVLVVSRGSGDAFARQFLPLIITLADHGLRGDRDGVYQALQRMRAGLHLERTAFEDGDAGDLAEKLDLLMERFGQAVAADAADRPHRVDVLLALRNLGTLTDAEYLAGLELRSVAEAMTTTGASAVDLTRVRVDGGAGWSDPELTGLGGIGHPAAGRVLSWARYVLAQGPGQVGARSRRTVLGVIHAVAVENVPLREIDRQARTRKGTAAKVVKAGLGLYAAMNASELPKCS